MNAISFFISVFDIFLTNCCHIWDTSGVRAVLMPSLPLSSSLIPSLLFYLSLSFSLLVSVVSKWHTEATTLAATYKKIFIAPTAANIYHTLVCVLCASVSVCWCVCVCVMVCVYCASLPAIIYTLLIFHHVTTATGCLFGCSSPDLHAYPACPLSLSIVPSLSVTLSLSAGGTRAALSHSPRAPCTLCYTLLFIAVAQHGCLPGIPQRGIVVGAVSDFGCCWPLLQLQFTALRRSLPLPLSLLLSLSFSVPLWEWPQNAKRLFSYSLSLPHFS